MSLPPTSTKGSGDATPITTFQINAPNIPITHSGVVATIGTIPIAGGGTGATTKAPAFDALSPMTTGGDIIYGGTSGTGTRLANGSAGQVLTSNGTTTAPSWQTAAGSFGQQEVRVITFNGRGAVNTEIFRFTTVNVNTGTDITYADSTNGGASFTINTAGVYDIYLQGRTATPGDQWYAVLNATVFTASTSTNTMLHWEQGVTNTIQCGSVSAYFAVNDVIRFGVVAAGGAVGGQARVVRVS